MKLVDLNVLLYAINKDAQEHAPVHRWWESALNGEEHIGLAWTVVLGFLRLTTRAGILPHPLTPTQALDTVQEWLDHPLVVVLHPGDGHWSHFRKLVETAGVAGNLTTDAHLAALAVEYDATLYTTDHDFKRFAGVRVKQPAN